MTFSASLELTMYIMSLIGHSLKNCATLLQDETRLHHQQKLVSFKVELQALFDTES